MDIIKVLVYLKYLTWRLVNCYKKSNLHLLTICLISNPTTISRCVFFSLGLSHHEMSPLVLIIQTQFGWLREQIIK